MARKLPTVSTDSLRAVGTAIFEAMGASHENAEFVADCVVNASLTGHDSHGVIYFVRYADRIREGIIDPQAIPQVARETCTTAIVDGRWSFGQLTARLAMRTVIEKARASTVGVVSAFRCNHIGRLGEWSMMAADQGMVGVVIANRPSAVAQPYGGIRSSLGTNPISVAAPAGKMDPFLLDFATSAVAEGKTILAALEGKKIPLGWIVDSSGKDTDDPNRLHPKGATRSEEQGRLLTFGARDGHKGYCLSMLVEILGGILTGAGTVAEQTHARPNQNGLLAMAIDVEGFIPLDEFKDQMGKLYEFIRKTPVDERFPHDHVLIPGEVEWETRKKRELEGIPVPTPVWAEIISKCTNLGLDIDGLLQARCG